MNEDLTWINQISLLSCKHRVALLKALTQEKEMEIRSIVEIGVYRGNTSKLFRLFFPEATLYLIDPWKIYDAYQTVDARPISTEQSDYENAYENVKQLFPNDPKVHILRKSSLEAAPEVPNNLDLVFIDGNHSYPFVKQDIQTWLPKVRDGGILAGHDYDPIHFPGVTQAVDELFGYNDVLLGPDRTWVKWKEALR
ncbi:MAG TPA: class I SAM-dependent methyltransferase [Chlamydiales bacterium]|nr:class I SAM-dependent methyltransferase [Chlamydiales bacterium]